MGPLNPLFNQQLIFDWLVKLNERPCASSCLAALLNPGLGSVRRLHFFIHDQDLRPFLPQLLEEGPSALGGRERHFMYLHLMPVHRAHPRL